MPGWDTVDSTATAVLALVMEVMAMVDLATDMARGPLMLRLSHGWDTVDSTATVVSVLAMAVMDMAVLDTATERGLLMLRQSLRPMPGWEMVVSTATVVLALVMVVMAMVALDTAMVALDTATERGLLMLRPSQRLMPGTDMVVSMDSQLMVAMAMLCGKKYQIPRLII